MTVIFYNIFTTHFNSQKTVSIKQVIMINARLQTSHPILSDGFEHEIHGLL